MRKVSLLFLVILGLGISGGFCESEYDMTYSRVYVNASQTFFQRIESLNSLRQSLNGKNMFEVVQDNFFLLIQDTFGDSDLGTNCSFIEDSFSEQILYNISYQGRSQFVKSVVADIFLDIYDLDSITLDMALDELFSLGQANYNYSTNTCGSSVSVQVCNLYKYLIYENLQRVGVVGKLCASWHYQVVTLRFYFTSEVGYSNQTVPYTVRANSSDFCSSCGSDWVCDSVKKLCLTQRRDSATGVFDKNKQCSYFARGAFCQNMPGEYMVLCPVTCNNTLFRHFDNAPNTDCGSEAQCLGLNSFVYRSQCPSPCGIFGSFKNLVAQSAEGQAQLQALNNIRSYIGWQQAQVQSVNQLYNSCMSRLAVRPGSLNESQSWRENICSGTYSSFRYDEIQYQELEAQNLQLTFGNMMKLIMDEALYFNFNNQTCQQGHSCSRFVNAMNPATQFFQFQAFRRYGNNNQTSDLLTYLQHPFQSTAYTIPNPSFYQVKTVYNGSLFEKKINLEYRNQPAHYATNMNYILWESSILTEIQAQLTAQQGSGTFTKPSHEYVVLTHNSSLNAQFNNPFDNAAYDILPYLNSLKQHYTYDTTKTTGGSCQNGQTDKCQQYAASVSASVTQFACLTATYLNITTNSIQYYLICKFNNATNFQNALLYDKVTYANQTCTATTTQRPYCNQKLLTLDNSLCNYEISEQQCASIDFDIYTNSNGEKELCNQLYLTASKCGPYCQQWTNPTFCKTNFCFDSTLEECTSSSVNCQLPYFKDHCAKTCGVCQ